MVQQKVLPEPCSEGLSLAVFRNMQKTLRGHNAITAWLDNPSLDDLGREQAEINRVQAWVKTLPKGCVRDEYQGWIEYFQYGLNEAYDELRNHGEAKHMKKYEESVGKESKAADELCGTIPAPPKR